MEKEEKTIDTSINGIPVCYIDHEGTFKYVQISCNNKITFGESQSINIIKGYTNPSLQSSNVSVLKRNIQQSALEEDE